MQFGFLTLFVVAFPLAPIVAMVANVIEGKIDSHKLLYLVRRTIPAHAENIGAWFSALNVMSYICVVTNTALTLQHAHFLDGLSGVERLLIFILIEHFIFIVKVWAEQSIPDTPFSVQEHIKRQTIIVDHLIRGVDVQDDDEFSTKKKNTKALAKRLANIPDAPADELHFFGQKSRRLPKTTNKV